MLSSEHHHHNDHHVHFSNESDEVKENTISVKKRSNTFWEVQLGFLQVNHTYEVVVEVPDELKYQELCDFAQKELPVPVHVKFINLESCSGGAQLKFVFKALHDKVTKEKLHLINKEGDELQFEVVARVLGKGKGTPLLRTGIHCIAVEPSGETEDTDWKGF